MHKSIDPGFLKVLNRDAVKVLRAAGVRGSLLADPVSNPKVAKNAKVNVLTAPMHLAPFNLSGFQVCPMATAGCAAACLHTAGNPLYMEGKARARIARTKAFFQHRAAFMARLVYEVAAIERQAIAADMKPGIRLNATSDIVWEKTPIIIAGVTYPNIMTIFPGVMFYDYTKRANRRDLPANYKLTFSLAEKNDADALATLLQGRNVAVVFNVGRNKPLPASFKIGRQVAWRVIDGDLHDYRPADEQGVIVGLRAKGKAIGDNSGFVRKVA